MLPIAKSTELCFVNKTLFDRFAAENGATLDDMRDFDKLFALCDAYYDWSEGQTMFRINDFYHYFLVNVASLGDTFIKDGRIDLTAKPSNVCGSPWCGRVFTADFACRTAMPPTAGRSPRC